MDDYDVLPFSDGSGELYMGTLRSGSYIKRDAGHGVDIWLEGYRCTAIIGWCNQVDKARDICRAWVDDGMISKALNAKPQEANRG